MCNPCVIGRALALRRVHWEGDSRHEIRRPAPSSKAAKMGGIPTPNMTTLEAAPGLRSRETLCLKLKRGVASHSPHGTTCPPGCLPGRLTGRNYPRGRLNPVANRAPLGDGPGACWWHVPRARVGHRMVRVLQGGSPPSWEESDWDPTARRQGPRLCPGTRVTFRQTDQGRPAGHPRSFPQDPLQVGLQSLAPGAVAGFGEVEPVVEEARA